VSETPLGRILAVDDERNVVESIKTALERVGYSVEVAASA